MYKSFDIFVYNSYIAVNFYGTFVPSVHCYDTLQFHNLKVINSTLGYITVLIQHGTSYVLNVTLDNVILMKTHRPNAHTIKLKSNSFYFININNISCYGYIQVHVEFLENYTSCQYFNTSIPIDSVVITNSFFADILMAVFINVSNNQMISINSCTVYNGLFIENIYYQALTMVSVLIVNTQLSFYTNYINKIDNIIFSNVSISNSSQTGLVLVNSKLTINGIGGCRVGRGRAMPDQKFETESHDIIFHHNFKNIITELAWLARDRLHCFLLSKRAIS